MENVVLTVHLILALLLIGVVLLQRSEGGGLGMGGGGGGGVMTGRQAANALSKLTWILAAGFLTTSLTLTIIASRNATGASVLDQLGVSAPAPSTDSAPQLPAYTPPPGVGQPIAPPTPEAAAPATTAPAATAPAATAPAATAPAATAPVETTPAAPAPATPPAAN